MWTTWNEATGSREAGRNLPLGKTTPTFSPLLAVRKASHAALLLPPRAVKSVSFLNTPLKANEVRGLHLSPAIHPVSKPRDGRLVGLGAGMRAPVERGKSVPPPSQVQVPAPPLPRCVALGMLLHVFKYPSPGLKKETNVCGVPDPLKGFNYYDCRYSYFLHYELSGVFLFVFSPALLKYILHTTKFANFRYTI